MGFSWTFEDRNGKDLLMEFDINSQAIGLAGDQSPLSIVEVRGAFAIVPYKDKLEDAARDALLRSQDAVRRNLDFYTGPAHPDCPCCTCQKEDKSAFFGFDKAQAKRFLSIPVDRVWRAHGGY